MSGWGSCNGQHLQNLGCVSLLPGLGASILAGRRGLRVPGEIAREFILVTDKSRSHSLCSDHKFFSLRKVFSCSRAHLRVQTVKTQFNFACLVMTHRRKLFAGSCIYCCCSLTRNGKLSGSRHKLPSPRFCESAEPRHGLAVSSAQVLAGGNHGAGQAAFLSHAHGPPLSLEGCWPNRFPCSVCLRSLVPSARAHFRS